MIYYDNAATSYPKPKRVTERLNSCLKKYCGNPGRSSHFLALRAAEEIYSVRERIAALLKLSECEGVVFTYNATYALNMAIKTLITQKCHVIISDIEHNSVIRPLEILKKKLGVEYDSFSTDGSIRENIESLLRPDTACIISTLASNVTGKEVSERVLSSVATRHGLDLILDASQAIGHREINLSDCPCSVLCAPAHKGLYGIQGAGFCVFREAVRRADFMEGGSGSDSINKYMPELLPEGYEAGTLSTPAISALGAGIDYINECGISAIKDKERELSEKIKYRIDSLKNSVLYPSFGGIISFNLKNIPSSEVARGLDRYNICVRSGLHCAPGAHQKLATLSTGTVRISLSNFNTVKEIDRFYKVLRGISQDI